MSHKRRRSAAFWSTVVIAGGSMLVAGCSTAPSLTLTQSSQPSSIENPSIPVSEIVKRTKCELINALKVPLQDADAHKSSGESPYYFLRDWVAKFDLTVTVNTQSGISPGVSLVNPLAQIVDKTRGTFPQSFSFGIGAGYSGSANRIDTLSYQLSLSEVYEDLVKPGKQKHKYYQDCEFERDTDLYGNLGLKEWIDSALNPLVRDAEKFAYLKRGRHHQGAAGQATSQASGQTSSRNQVLARAADLRQAVSDTASKTQEEQSSLFKILNAASVNEINSLIDCSRTKEICESMHRRWKIDLTVNSSKLDSNNKEIVKKFVDDLIKDMDTVSSSNSANDPPIDAVSHSVSFIVAMNASATPTWSLMKFKGPGGATGGSGTGGSSGSSTTAGSGTGTSSSFLSATRSDTHTLLITLGSGTPSGLSASAEAVRNSTLIGNAISNSIRALPQP